MNPRAMLRKSVLIQPAELELRRAETAAELEDAWSDWCDGFAEGSAERRELREVYQDQAERIRRRNAGVRLLRNIGGAG